MISNQILQNTIDGLKNITRIDLCIIDTEGKILATTFSEADRYVSPAMALVDSPADSQVVSGCHFFKVFDEHQLEYVLLANGDSDDVYMVGQIASSRFRICWLHIRNDLIKTILSRTCCWITCFW